MVLIFSEKNDHSTSAVISWLLHYGCKFLRVNGGKPVEKLSIEISNSQSSFYFLIDGMEFSSDEISSYWFRRGGLNFKGILSIPQISDDLMREIKLHLKLEADEVKRFVHNELRKKKSIGDPFTDDVSKLISLQIAKECGLSVPETLITTDTNKVLNFFTKNGKIITKGIYGVACYEFDTTLIGNYTEEIHEDELIITSNKKIFPSLFQERLDKLYELRIFYLNGDFYSMSIFSQLDKKTQVDFRKYNLKKPNRTVPYKLPREVEQKLHHFMKRMNLRTGSIDMVVTKDYQFVFLEVNPIGQFGMVSRPCNYKLEKRIAEFLSTR